MSLLSDVVNANPAITPAQKAEFKAMHPGGVVPYLKHLPVLAAGAAGPLAFGGEAAGVAASGGDPNAGTGVPLDGGGPDPAALQSLYDTYLGGGASTSPDVTGSATGGGTGGILKNVLSFIGKNPLQAAQVGLAGLNAINAAKLKSQQFRLMNQGLNRVNTAADATAPPLNLRAPGSVQAMVGARP